MLPSGIVAFRHDALTPATETLSAILLDGCPTRFQDMLQLSVEVGERHGVCGDHTKRAVVQDALLDAHRQGDAAEVGHSDRTRPARTNARSQHVRMQR